MKNSINLIATNEEQGQRIDRYISNTQKNLSRTRVKNLILRNKLKINGLIENDPSKKIKKGDDILLIIPKPSKTSLKPFNYKIDIIFEDKDLMIINKSAGISMHPGAGDYDKTLVNALIQYDSKNLSSIGDELRPGIVHRIDKDTSGLVAVSYTHLTLPTIYSV